MTESLKRISLVFRAEKTQSTGTFVLLRRNSSAHAFIRSAFADLGGERPKDGVSGKLAERVADQLVGAVGLAVRTRAETGTWRFALAAG
jgi:hypothetical protein